MTPDSAIVWHYIQGTTSADHTRPVNIKLLHPSNNARHPLPLGVLVPTSSEPALLVVMPIGGKITYWESLSSAATADVSRQKQQSVQGTISGLMSGEMVTEIIEAEPRGFILTFSTGRLAHLVVSDSQGRPTINAQFLRDNGVQSGGVFGSLRSVFSGGGWRKDVAAVRAGSSSQRGQRYMVVATSEGSFQIWDLNWNGTHTLLYSVDAKMDILQSLVESADLFHGHEECSFEVLDFTVLPGHHSGKEVSKSKESGDCQVMALTVIKGSQSSRYALVGLILADSSVTIDVVHPIHCYKTSIPTESGFRPQILVPEPGETAYVIFEKSLVLVSLAELDRSPSSQLQMEAYALPDPFQDAIDFQTTKPYRIVGCAPEAFGQGHNQSSCAVMVYGFGLIRISTLPIKEGQSALDRATVTAKSKIEQAVFFGSLQQDLLDFDPRPEMAFSPKEIEAAALSVSHSIMSSTSAYIAAIGPSMDQQLQRRATALADLNKYLRRHYPASLSRLTNWSLLWSAEKMASARAIWRCYNSAISSQNKGSDERNLLAELIEAMSEDVKTENKPEHHETDGVRHWFIHDIWRLEYIIPWAQNMVEMLFQEGKEDTQELDLATEARLVSEANDIQLAGLETAFKFRETHIAAYGLENEIMLDGVLQRNYEDLPDIWTSLRSTVDRVKLLTNVSRELARRNEDIEEGGEGEPSPDLIVKIAADNPRQVQICCQTHIERFRWLKSRPDDKSKAAGENLMNDHFADRKVLFASLSDIGQPDMGIQLAEKYRDMEALVEIIHQELEIADDDTASKYEDRIESYFVKYGTVWADAYFQKYLNGGRAVTVLTDKADFKKHLTQFLRNHPPYAKLGWINEIVSERNYSAAANTLKMAQKQEANLWSRKIGLSMSKLSLMAAKSIGQVQTDTIQPSMQKIDETMAILATQEKLYKYIKPTIMDALDADAETDLAMQKYGTYFVKGKPLLRNSLKQHMQKMLAMETLPPEGLIDLLTLIDEDTVYSDDEGVMGNRFLAALKVLRLSNFESTDPGRQELLEKFIWRRCMIQDDWEDVNRTELKNDTQVEVETGATSLFKTLKEGYRTDFWEKQSPLPPASVMEAGTTVESLRISSQFANMPESVLELLARDLEVEADVLDHYIEKGRLEEWWKGVLEAAKAAARAEADEEGEAKLRRRDAERELDRRIERKDNEAYGKGGQGSSMDGEGDVMMG